MILSDPDHLEKVLKQMDADYHKQIDKVGDVGQELQKVTSR